MLGMSCNLGLRERHALTYLDVDPRRSFRREVSVWDIDTRWFDVSVILGIFAVGNIVELVVLADGFAQIPNRSPMA